MPLFASFSLASIPKVVLIGVPVGVVALVGAAVFYEYEKHKKASLAAAPPAAIQQQPVQSTGPTTSATGPVSVSAPAPAPLTSAMLANMGMTGNPTTVANAALALVTAMAAQPTPPGNTNALMAFQASIGLPQTGWYDSPTSIHLQDVLSMMGIWSSAMNQLPNESWPNKPTPGGAPHLILNLIPTSLAAKAVSAAAAAPSGSVLSQAQAAAQQLVSTMPSPFPGDVMSIYSQLYRAALNAFIATPTVGQLGSTLTALQSAATSAGNDPSSAAAAPVFTNAYNILNRSNQTLQT